MYRTEIDVPARLRRAILQNDVLLVKRIIKNNPVYLENPDFEDGSNTSLHLAAIKGHLDILVCPSIPPIPALAQRRRRVLYFFERG